MQAIAGRTRFGLRVLTHFNGAGKSTVHKELTKRNFASMSKGTFGYEDELPNLEVPDLENTITKYLDSVQAVASKEEFENTRKIGEGFLKGTGLRLQAHLKQRERSHRNWVEKLWLDKGYLELRLPLQYMNFTGSPTYSRQFWPPQDGSQLQRMAHSMNILAQFYWLLYSEKVEVHKGSGGTIFSMDQFRTSFNTCQIPRKGQDGLDCYFRPASEGDTPKHAVVICKGFLFKVNLYSPKTGKPYTQPQFEEVLKSIAATCNSKNYEAPGIAALTSLDRDSWADIRDHIISYSITNKQNLMAIESSIGVFTIDDAEANNRTATMKNVLCGNPTLRWRDKSYNEVWSRSGTMATCCAHSAMDGMVMVMYIEFCTMLLKLCNGKWNGSSAIDDISPIEELAFDITDKVTAGIAKGKQIAYKFNDDLCLKNIWYDYFGKSKLKKYKIYPDAIIQISLQLAYMRLHGKPASTYETATTRQFYHGRTETCRTCTPELVAFCKAAIESGSNDDPKVWAKLKAAHAKFAHLMDECKNNRGCDRHLFGLAVAAQELGIPLPDLFQDPMYAKSGGGGNFILSTSFVGFFNACGVVAPMLENGYGCFYRIVEDSVVCTMTSWRYSKETNINQLSSYLSKSLCDVFEMFKKMYDSKL